MQTSFIWPLEPSDGKSSDPSVGSAGSGSAGGAAVAGAVIGTHCSTGGITGDVDDSHSGCGSKGFEANIGNGNVSIALSSVSFSLTSFTKVVDAFGESSSPKSALRQPMRLAGQERG